VLSRHTIVDGSSSSSVKKGNVKGGERYEEEGRNMLASIVAGRQAGSQGRGFLLSTIVEQVLLLRKSCKKKALITSILLTYILGNN